MTILKSCFGCFANTQDPGDGGCMILDTRIDDPCPFKKTAEQFKHDRYKAAKRLEQLCTTSRLDPTQSGLEVQIYDAIRSVKNAV